MAPRADPDRGLTITGASPLDLACGIRSGPRPGRRTGPIVVLTESRHRVIERRVDVDAGSHTSAREMAVRPSRLAAIGQVPVATNTRAGRSSFDIQLILSSSGPGCGVDLRPARPALGRCQAAPIPPTGSVDAETSHHAGRAPIDGSAPPCDSWRRARARKPPGACGRSTRTQRARSRQLIGCSSHAGMIPAGRVIDRRVDVNTERVGHSRICAGWFTSRPGQCRRRSSGWWRDGTLGPVARGLRVVTLATMTAHWSAGRPARDLTPARGPVAEV